MKDKKLDEYNIVSNITRIILLFCIIPFLISKEFDKAGFVVITILLTFYDFLVKKILKIELSKPLKYSILFLILTTELCGSAFEFYDKFHWWDTFVHGASGIMNFFIGIELINKLNKNLGKEEIHVGIQILFAISFSIAILGLWEIAEFILDEMFDLNMQITAGLKGQDAIWDTIEDMISATIGTIIATIMYAIKLKIK